MFASLRRAGTRHAARRLAAAAAGTVASAGATAALCHGNHGGEDAMSDRLAKLEQRLSVFEAQHAVQHTTGQGDAVFSWSVELTDAFPEDAKPFEKDMHGGFNEDVETGIVYTGVPGYGLCSISPDLKTWTLLGTDERLKSNIHGIVCFKHAGQTRLALAQNEASRVLIVALDGTVLQELGAPKGGEFDFGEANMYYSHTPTLQVPWGDRDGRHVCRGAAQNPRRRSAPTLLCTHAPRALTPAEQVPAFACTDVTYLDGRLYVVTGYCKGDFVLTATEEDGQWKWGPIAWGGKGDAPGKFDTAHGVFAHDGSIFVANREAHQVLEFTPTGKLVRALPDIPDGARICNVSRAEREGWFVMNALEPIRHTPAKTAAIYAHSGERLLSTIEPGELGIPILKHLHHCWPHYVPGADGERGVLHLLVHGWSAGKYAVLKHEPGGLPSTPKAWSRRSEPLKK